MAKKKVRRDRIDAFDFPEGRIIAGKYRIMDKLGHGWESEVYKIVELSTRIVRAAKFFFPHRNVKNKAADRYAIQLHKLSSCPVLIHYHTQEFFWHRGHRITCLISEYVEGEMLETYLKRQPGKRIGVFHGLHLLHALVKGLEHMHRLGEYHGDLHTGNVIVRRYGLGYDLKFLDMYHRGPSKGFNKTEDVIDVIRIFYDAIGGRKLYGRHPQEVKEICLGLRRDLIAKKFRTAGQLRQFIENIEWTSSDRV